MDPRDMSLTPNHFVNGQMGGQLDPELTDEKRFQRHEKMAENSRTS